MKRTFLLLTLVCGMVFQANAQEKGQIWVGGTVGFNSTKYKDIDEKVNSFTISSEVGYGFSDQWGTGIRLGYSHTNFDYDEDYKTKINDFIIEPFARYTFLRWNAFSVFVDGGLSFQNGKLK